MTEVRPFNVASVIGRFKANPKLTIAIMAPEYGYTEEKFWNLLEQRAPKGKVKDMRAEDARRSKRQRSKGVKQINDTSKQNRAEDAARLNDSLEKQEQRLLKITKMRRERDSDFKEIENELQEQKRQLERLLESVKECVAKIEESLDIIRERKKGLDEKIEEIERQIEESSLIFLIEPGYTGKLPENYGRLISTEKVSEGVEVEKGTICIDDLGLEEVLSLMNDAGYTMEPTSFVRDMNFALLAGEYRISESKVRLICNDDSKVPQLVKLVTPFLV